MTPGKKMTVKRRESEETVETAPLRDLPTQVWDPLDAPAAVYREKPPFSANPLLAAPKEPFVLTAFMWFSPRKTA